jgi:hydroxyethylthiazole kinase-like sugar kinase family protein
MPGCVVSATTASFCSVEKRRLRATTTITSIFENVSA